MRRAVLVFALLVTVFSAASAQGRYRPEDWVSYSAHRFVSAIAVGPRYVYFATTGGVSQYDLIRDKWAEPITTGDGLPDPQVNVVAVDRLFNDLWCATPRGVARFNETSRSWTTYISGGGKSLMDVRSIGVTETGLVVFDTGSGAAVHDLATSVWMSVEEIGFSRKIDLSGIRWYGARNQRPYAYPIFRTDHDYLFDPPAAISSRYRSYAISTSEDDRTGRVWVGTWGLNVGKASLRSWTMTMERIGLHSRNIRAMAEDGDHIWFGCEPELYSAEPSPFSPSRGLFEERGGLTRYNRNTGEWTYFTPDETDGLPAAYARAIAADRQFVWFGTHTGVVALDKSTGVWTPFPIQTMTSADVVCLAVTPTDVWIGASSGLNRLERLTGAIRPVNIAELRSARIYDIAVDERQTLWLTTDRGVYQRNARGVWKKIEDPQTVNLNGPVYHIEIDSTSIWFVNGAALLEYNRNTGQWKSSLLPLTVGDSPAALQLTERFVWVGGRNGVARFDRRKGLWKTYTVRDGLIDDTVQAILPDGDYIWFGTPQGTTRFFWNDPSP